jgi:hypothetical protein
MMDAEKNTLLIDEVYETPLLEEEAKELSKLQEKFIDSYIENKDKMEVGDWLKLELKHHLSEKTDEEIEEYSYEIIDTIKVNEQNRASLEEAIQNGRSKESWFASTIKQSTSHMSMEKTAEYLHGLDEALKGANESMQNVLTTKSGAVSQNVNLDGFIAEQHHVNSFNIEAQLTGSQYRAEVQMPKDGQPYGRNSVDIVIKDQNGKVVRRYQSKYCKDAASTQKALENGDYRGQRKLVGEGQAKDISKATEFIEAPDGTKSQALSKQRAKELQDEAQSGKWKDLNWNEYRTKDLAIGIGKQAGYAALQGAAIGAGMELATKIWKGEEIKGKDVVDTALKTGADFGVKAAAAGALKVGVEKGLLVAIPKGTPAGTIANIAYVAVENVKIAIKVAKGEMTVKEGLNQMEITTVSTVAGIAAGAKGAVIGASIGAVLGPVGAAVGGFVGGTVGYIAGSKVAETVIKGVQKVREVATSVVKSVVSTVSSGIKSFARGVASIFS